MYRLFLGSILLCLVAGTASADEKVRFDDTFLDLVAAAYSKDDE